MLMNIGIYKSGVMFIVVWCCCNLLIIEDMM